MSNHLKTYVLVEASFDIWEKLPGPIRQALIEVYPDGHEPGSRNFYAFLPTNDPRVARILSVLNKAGLEPWREIHPKRPNEFTFGKIRKYDHAEFESLRLLQPLGRPKTQDSYIWPAKDGTLQVKSRYFKLRGLLDMGDLHSLLVSQDIRLALEQEGFTGMVFRPVVPQEGGAVVPLDNLWELRTEHRLPPLSDYCTFYDRLGSAMKGSSEVAYQYFEDFWGPQELHYTAKSLEAWSWPDFALTHELFWFSEKRHRRLLVTSQRFFQFCKAHKLKMEWVPVQIDPE
jgi:hypothetical protein